MAKDSILVTVSLHSALRDAIQECKHTCFLRRGLGSFLLFLFVALCLVDHDSGLSDMLLPLTIHCERGRIIIVSCPKVFEVLVPPSSFDIFVWAIFQQGLICFWLLKFDLGNFIPLYSFVQSFVNQVDIQPDSCYLVRPISPFLRRPSKLGLWRQYGSWSK